MTKELDASEALEILDRLHSDEDPIEVDGKKTTASDYLYSLWPMDRVDHIQIRFATASGKWCTGTFWDMIKDRKKPCTTSRQTSKRSTTSSGTRPRTSRRR